MDEGLDWGTRSCNLNFQHSLFETLYNIMRHATCQYVESIFGCNAPFGDCPLGSGAYARASLENTSEFLLTFHNAATLSSHHHWSPESTTDLERLRDLCIFPGLPRTVSDLKLNIAVLMFSDQKLLIVRNSISLQYFTDPSSFCLPR